MARAARRGSDEVAKEASPLWGGRKVDWWCVLAAVVRSKPQPGKFWSGGAGSDMATQKVLALADREAERAVVAEAIGGAGWEIAFAAALPDLLDQLALNRPTVLLLDERLLAPDQAGSLERIRLAVAPSRVPMILLADTADSERRSPSLTGVIALPLDARHLSRQFAQIVEEDRYLVQFANLTELGGEEFLFEMIDLFQEQGPKKLQEARTALAAGDPRTVNRAVHSLKSSAANLGAERLRMLAARIEKLTADQMVEGLPQLLDELEQTYGQVKSRLERRRGGQG
jgi:HPt (histidine-containing phosphotransfer) domain-containing protein